MTTQEYLCRHFARMGARVVVRGPRLRQRTKIAIDVGRDRSGEVFVIGCEEEVAIEVLDVQPQSHHLVLMIRDGSEKHKFLLGRDERHWFAAAVPGDGVRDVRTAIASLRPTEIEGREAIRQGEWFFVPEPGVNDKDAVILRNEPLSRGGGSKPHVCAQMMRKGGEAVMVCSRYPTGIEPRRVPEAHRTQPRRATVSAGAAWCATLKSMRVAKSGTGITRRLISGAGIACT